MTESRTFGKVPFFILKQVETRMQISERQESKKIWVLTRIFYCCTFALVFVIRN